MVFANSGTAVAPSTCRMDKRPPFSRGPSSQPRPPANTAPWALPRAHSSYSMQFSSGKALTAQSAPKALKKVVTSPSHTSAPLYPNEVMPNLYISDLDTACAVLSPNYAAPGRPKIKYILTILDNRSSQPKVLEEGRKSDFVMKFISLRDWNDVNMIQCLPEARDFIKLALSRHDGGVLVHCRKGVSRSGSFVVAYVMESLNMDYAAALAHVQKARFQVKPNVGFVEQLRLWGTLQYSLFELDGEEREAYRQWRSSMTFRTAIEGID